jgi:hypothetical protein
MTNEAWLRRKATPGARVLIVLLTLYAVLVIALDPARPFVTSGNDKGERRGWPWAWYPIATLGFEADNNGRVKSVTRDGPAWQAGLPTNRGFASTLAVERIRFPGSGSDRRDQRRSRSTDG